MVALWHVGYLTVVAFPCYNRTPREEVIDLNFLRVDEDDRYVRFEHTINSSFLLRELLGYLPAQDYEKGEKKFWEIRKEIDGIEADIALTMLKPLYIGETDSLEEDMAKAALLGTGDLTGVNRAFVLGYLWNNILKYHFEDAALFLEKAEPYIDGWYPVVYF